MKSDREVEQWLATRKGEAPGEPSRRRLLDRSAYFARRPETTFGSAFAISQTSSERDFRRSMGSSAPRLS